jgi:hypothetical protein
MSFTAACSAVPHYAEIDEADLTETTLALYQGTALAGPYRPKL